MEKRILGSTQLRVSEVGLGCARIGGIFQQGSKGFVELLEQAIDAGINFFDTADMYSQGESESLLGRAVRGKRDRVVIASKAGYRLPAQRRWIAKVKPLVRPLIRLLGLRRESLPSLVKGSPTQDFSTSYLLEAVEGSLRRLGTDHLDLFQLHSPPAEVVERGEGHEALERLKQQGKIRYWGISCDTTEAALAALKWPGISSLQVLINLLEQRAIGEVLPAAREKKVAVIAREVLANGLLVKDAADLDLAALCKAPGEAERRARQLEEVRRLAAKSGCSPAQLALQFVRHLDGVPVALIGVRSSEQLAANLRWLEGPEVESGALRAIGS